MIALEEVLDAQQNILRIVAVDACARYLQGTQNALVNNITLLFPLPPAHAALTGSCPLLLILKKVRCLMFERRKTRKAWKDPR